MSNLNHSEKRRLLEAQERDAKTKARREKVILLARELIMSNRAKRHSVALEAASLMLKREEHYLKTGDILQTSEL